jgi:hypothetical protein
LSCASVTARRQLRRVLTSDKTNVGKLEETVGK